MRRYPWRTRSKTHSAPVLVLPQPRPLRMSHTNQSPTGASCSGRAISIQDFAGWRPSSVRCSRRLRSSSAAALSRSDAEELIIGQCRHVDFALQIDLGPYHGVEAVESVPSLHDLERGIDRFGIALLGLR